MSALDGVPFTVKDNIFAARLPATWGSAAYKGFQPNEDEPAIARLRAAGAIIIGKTNVPEFTVQGYTSNALFGPTFNPLAHARSGRVWNGPNGPQCTRLSAVLAAERLTPWSLGQRGARFIENPWATRPVEGSDFRIEAFRPRDGRLN